MKTYDPSKFKTLRELTGLSHRAFGNAINRSRSWVISCENGSAFPDVRDLDEIAKKFQVDQASFWRKVEHQDTLQAVS